MARYWVPVLFGVVLLALGIAAFVVGSIPSYSTTYRYLSFSEVNVDVVIDVAHVYSNTIAAVAEDKFVFNLTTNDRFVNLTLSDQYKVIYAENFIDEFEFEFLTPSNGTHYLVMNAPQLVTVNGTVSVLRLTTTATATAFYLGLGLCLTIFSFVFILYGVYLNFEKEKERLKPKVEPDKARAVRAYCNLKET